MENGELPSKEQQGEISKPNALVESARILNSLFDIRLTGCENIKTIPQGKKVIIVTTHAGNYDIPLVISALGDYFGDITVVQQSANFIFWQDPKSYLGNLLIGSRYSFRVDFVNREKNHRGKFNPKNFRPMKESLETGKPLAIGAYFDPMRSGKTNELPKRAGNGAAYLAQITKDAIILPVAVDIKSDSSPGLLDLLAKRVMKKRIGADVIVGEPFVPDHIEEIDRIEVLLEKRKSDPESITKDELQEFSNLIKKLKEQSGIIMQHLAELLPPQKRGVWNKK